MVIQLKQPCDFLNLLLPSLALVSQEKLSGSYCRGDRKNRMTYGWKQLLLSDKLIVYFCN